MPTGGNAEMCGDRFADIGIGGPDPDRAGADTRTKGHDRHALAGMVRAAPGRIAAMVGGQYHQIARLQPAVKIRQGQVKGFKRCGITRHVTPMTVDHVEIDEIGEDEIAVRRLVHRGKRR
ncbi:hypothetical protein D3C87_1823590 [compost metagenome]